MEVEIIIYKSIYQLLIDSCDTFRFTKAHAHGKYTYANLMTQAGNKNCHPLWLFKTFTGATKKHYVDTKQLNFFGKARPPH